jgi:photosystem II stability/assembly factor-like uncharacterized protein
MEFSVQAPLASKSLLIDVATIDDLVVVVGERGHILLSEDQGTTWRQAEVPTRSGLNAVFFYDRKLGWAVGHDGVIVRTRDSGVTWERVRWAPEEENPFMDVWFADAEHGFAIGAYGSFFETSDGGTTWTSRYISEDDFHLNQIVPAGGDRLYIAAEAGLFYRSDDGGATWAELPTPYEGSFFGVLPLEGDSVLAFGLRGHLFRSDDAGENWIEVETNTVSMLTNSIRLDDGTIIVTGLGGVILVSRDGGHTFELHQHCNRRGISAVGVVSDDTLVFVGEFGVRTLPMSKLNERKDG